MACNFAVVIGDLSTILRRARLVLYCATGSIPCGTGPPQFPPIQPMKLPVGPGLCPLHSEPSPSVWLFQVYRLAEVVEATKQVETGRTRGKVVLSIP